jgi:hypothetical protein
MMSYLIVRCEVCFEVMRREVERKKERGGQHLFVYILLRLHRKSLSKIRGGVALF